MPKSTMRRSPVDLPAPPDDDDGDDYLTMSIAEPAVTGPETSMQRRARKIREAEIKARVKTKKELEKEAEIAREQGLSTAIDQSSKGFKMLSKLGYKPGDTLGRVSEARTEPIQPVLKGDRAGIGFATKQKRSLIDEAQASEKRSRLEEVDYRLRLGQESNERRLEQQLRGAQKVAEALDTEAVQRGEDDRSLPKTEDRPDRMSTAKSAGSLKDVNVYWRGLAIEQMEDNKTTDDISEQDHPYEIDDVDDNVEHLRKSNYVTELTFSDEESDDDDELSQFNALPVKERLQKVTTYLRDTYNYCFWCMYHYPDKEMDGCPGPDEDEHG